MIPLNKKNNLLELQCKMKEKTKKLEKSLATSSYSFLVLSFCAGVSHYLFYKLWCINVSFHFLHFLHNF